MNVKVNPLDAVRLVVAFVGENKPSEENCRVFRRNVPWCSHGALMIGDGSSGFLQGCLQSVTGVGASLRASWLWGTRLSVVGSVANRRRQYRWKLPSFSAWCSLVQPRSPSDRWWVLWLFARAPSVRYRRGYVLASQLTLGHTVVCRGLRSKPSEAISVKFANFSAKCSLVQPRSPSDRWWVLWLLARVPSVLYRLGYTSLRASWLGGHTVDRPGLRGKPSEAISVKIAEFFGVVFPGAATEPLWSVMRCLAFCKGAFSPLPAWVRPCEPVDSGAHGCLSWAP